MQQEWVSAALNTRCSVAVNQQATQHSKVVQSDYLAGMVWMPSLLLPLQVKDVLMRGLVSAR